MTWLNITRYGSGRIRLAAVIEGWPEIWVTDPTLTLSNGTNGARGRTVRNGLLRQGLQFTERALLLQGKLEASAMTFRFRSTDQTRQTVASFATVPSIVGELSADLETADITITTLSGAPATGYYHIGTEVIHTQPEGPGENPWPITRAHWDTQAQSFYLLDGENQLSHQVYSRPRSMEGRRITLYVWGDGDDETGYDPTGASATLGHPVWRGIVSLPPRLDRDALTWSITADHISKIFDQQLCARGTEVRPVGIHFSYGSRFYVGTRSVLNTVLGFSSHMGWFPDTPAFVTFANTALDNLLADTDNGLADNFDNITIQQDARTGVFYLHAVTNGAPSGFLASHLVDIRSHFTGECIAGSGASPWMRVSDNTVVGVFADFQANEAYRADFVLAEWATESPFGSVQTIFGQGEIEPAGAGYTVKLDNTLATTSDIAEWDARRIFIDRSWADLSARSITIARDNTEPRRDPEGKRTPYQTETLTFTVLSSGFDATRDAHWIQVENVGDANRWNGWVHSDTTMFPTYAPESRTDVVGFVSALIADVAANANDGNLPFIRDVDFDTSTEVVSSVDDITRSRAYRFVKPVAVSDVIAEELKLAGYAWSTDRDSAKVTFRPIPVVTGNIPATLDDQGDDIVIDGSVICTPAGGQGAMPGYELQSQGIVSVVNIKDGYDAAQDTHVGTPHIVKDQNLLSTHKRRALTEMTIAPKSTASAELTPEDGIKIAATMMAVLGREYVTVKVSVTMARARVALLDVVRFTSPHVPNANGSMGVSGKRAIVIGRSVSLDVSRDEHVDLELLMLLEDLVGYTPSGVISGQSGSHPNWTLTLSTLFDANILISPRGDGDVAGTFAVGDKIRILQQGATAPTSYTGTVTSVSGATVGVTLDISWTPGSDVWQLEFDVVATATTTQKLFCYVAEEDGTINAGESAARRFA